MDNSLLIIFVALTALAVVIQAGILVALYITVKKVSFKVDGLFLQFNERVLPVMDAAGDLILDLGPKVKVISANLVETTTTIKGQVEKMDAALTSITEKAQNQVDRAEQLVSNTINKVENTTTILQNAVLSPVHQVAGVINGLTVGVTSLFSKRRRQPPNGSGADDELFI